MPRFKRGGKNKNSATRKDTNFENVYTVEKVLDKRFFELSCLYIIIATKHFEILITK